MDKGKVIFCILAVLVMILLLCFRCSWTTEKTSKGSAIRRPKCGDFFSSKEGAETFEWMRAEPRR